MAARSSELRALAASSLCCSFSGSAWSGADAETLERLQPAGIILFGRNIVSAQQLRELTRAIAEALGDERPPLIATDQEGGRVARIRFSEPPPSMMALGATGDEDLAYQTGCAIGATLRDAGINLNFAPVLDLAVEPLNTVIGTRSFGDDPQLVASLAGAVARGLRATGVIPVFKHFPGHGRTALDSHVALPRIAAPVSQLREADFAPFATLLPDAQAVMAAHVVIEALDERPASVSPKILGDLLREEMRFRGACFTDSIEMGALKERYGVERAAVLALQAGADCVVMNSDARTVETTALEIARALEDGELPVARLEEARERVHRLRAPEVLEPAAGVAETIARRAITLVRGEPRVEAPVSLVCFRDPDHGGAEDAVSRNGILRTEFLRRGIECEEILCGADGALPAFPTQSGSLVVLMRRAHIFAGQRRTIEKVLKSRADAILISTREPFDSVLFPQAKTVLCTYGDDGATLRALAEVLSGERTPVGTLPVRVAS